jgi:hypothetical protein
MPEVATAQRRLKMAVNALVVKTPTERIVVNT